MPQTNALLIQYMIGNDDAVLAWRSSPGRHSVPKLLYVNGPMVVMLLSSISASKLELYVHTGVKFTKRTLIDCADGLL